MPGPLANKTIVITGATDGIGRVAAQRLSATGARLVIVGRNAAKTEAAANAIMSENGLRNVTWEIADLSSQRDVDALAQRLLQCLPRIDILINNAGAIFSRRAITDDGLERTFALNHLAYFTLTLNLLGKLAATGTPDEPSRIIVVSSEAHRRATLDLTDLQSERSFRAWRAYENSKLENLLFTRALNTRLGTNVIVHALHPGVVDTRFAVSGNGRWGRFMRRLMNLKSISAAEGADTLVWLATSAEVARGSGGYWIKRTVRAPSADAMRDDLAHDLWRRSAALAHIDADALVLRASAAS